jgi:hypothetical protein
MQAEILCAVYKFHIGIKISILVSVLENVSRTKVVSICMNCSGKNELWPILVAVRSKAQICTARLQRSWVRFLGSFGGSNVRHGTGTLEDILRQDAGDQLW